MRTLRRVLVGVAVGIGLMPWGALLGMYLWGGWQVNGWYYVAGVVVGVGSGWLACRVSR